MFVGEKHGIKENFDIYYNYMKKFNKNNNEQLIVLLEIGYSAGVYIDEYIHGKELYNIDEFMQDFEGTLFHTNYFKEYILKLKKHIAIGNDIKVIGIDIEHQKNIAEKVLKKIDNVEKMDNINRNLEYANIIKNYSDKDYEIEREECLYINFLKYVKNRQCICFIGAYHTSLYQKEGYNTLPLCARLKDKLKKMICLDIIYINTRRKINIDGKFKIIKVNDEFENENYIHINDIYIEKDNINKGTILITNGKEI